MYKSHVGLQKALCQPEFLRLLAFTCPAGSARLVKLAVDKKDFVEVEGYYDGFADVNQTVINDSSRQLVPDYL